MAANIHVVNKDGSWQVEEEGGSGSLSQHPTRDEAVEAGKSAAQGRKVELLVHREDGTIGERDSYGHDVPGNQG